MGLLKMLTLAAGVQGAEIDVAGGIKPKFLGPKWSPNIGWVHYFYAPEDLSPDYGEIYAKTDYSFGKDDKFTLRGLVFFAPDYNQSGFTATYIAGGGRVKFWQNKVAVYAGAGYQFFEDPNAFAQAGLDGRRFLLLEIINVRCPLLGHRPFRHRMCLSQRIYRRL